MTDLNGVNEAFKKGLTLKLENRGPRSSGITFELKSIFDEMAKKGLIKDTDGKGLTKQDALNMYAKLNEIHKSTNRATNYTRMQVGQEFNYNAEELLALAEASGYEIVPQEAESTPQQKLEPTVTKSPKEDDINQPTVEHKPEPTPPQELNPSVAKLPKEDDINQPTVEYKPEPTPVHQKNEKLTPEQVEEFAAKDERVANLEAQLGELKSNADDLEAKYKASLADGDLGHFNSMMGGYSDVDVKRAKDKFESAQQAISQYKKLLSNWQDGQKYILQFGKWAGSEYESATLPNGQKGYKFEKTENGQKVEYYFNISFEPKFGMASDMPGELVDRVVID